MPQELLSVEQVAARLGLHVRTVRGYVREGRLRAVRIGKQYRITTEDLDAFTGRPVPTSGGASGGPRVEASSIVHVDPVTPELADRLRTTLSAAVGSREDGSGLARVECLHDRERERLTIVVLGSAAAAAEVLRLVDVLVERA